MPTLEGVLPDQPGPTSPCRWCGAPTDLTFAPGGSKVGPVPLHMLCGADFIRTVQQLSRGLAIKPRQQARLDRFNGLALADGHAAPSSPNVLSARHDLQ